MMSNTLTSEQMETLLLSLGYKLYPSKGPQRVFENREFDAIQLLPPAGKEPYARLEHLMTLRKVSVEKGIVDEETFEALLEKARQRQPEPTASPTAA
ncbi:MAG TPA: hypothetical protein VKU00_27520 [Chthonomonadaceae bacterium]|nr:hypothetical protein [Chthonomonadaceae bacterium]